MKKLISATLSFLLCASSFAEVRPVTLGDITKRVSSDNYYVLANAQKVYQAKQTIQLARRSLLPKLNLWRIIETPFSAQGLLGLVGDIVPFLVPNNWLRVKEEKLFAQATQFGYKALWANEMLTARGLLLQASLDERLAESLNQNMTDLTRIYEVVRSRELMGAVPAGSSKQMEIQILASKEEIQTITRVIRENRSQLAFILGYPGNDEAVPAGVQYVSRAMVQPLRYEDFEETVLSESPEKKQYTALMRAADFVRKSRYFTFLGSSPLSRGSAGGIFDDLPMQDGLGFGLAPSIRIVRSQKRILGIQRDAVEETMRKDLKLLVESYNSDLIAREDAARRVGLAEEYLLILEDRLRLGFAVDAPELVLAAEGRLNALSAYHAIEVRMLLNADRLRRLTFTDAYKK